MQKQREKAWGFLPRDLQHRCHILYNHVTEKTDLVFCTSQEDETCTNRGTTLARSHSFEGLLNDVCEISAAAKFSNKDTAFGFTTLTSKSFLTKVLLLDLRRLHQSHSSVVLLQTQVCCQGRTCLLAETNFVCLASLWLKNLMYSLHV